MRKTFILLNQMVIVWHVFSLSTVRVMNSLKNKLELIERDEINKALRDCEWIQSRAARQLGITERMIGYKIKKYNIKIGREADLNET